MRRLAAALVAAICLMGVAHTQQVYVSDVEGLWGPDTILAGQPATFVVSFENTSAETITGFTHGFRFWTALGGSRSVASVDSAFFVAQAIKAGQDFLQGLVRFSADGMGSDTLGIWAIKLDSVGMRPGYHEPISRFTVTADSAAEGEQLCLDSCWYPPQGEWVWSIDVTSLAPDWSGPHCYYVHYEPDGDGDGVPDVLDNCPEISNPSQEDTDSNGVGDACCCLGIRGNVNSDDLDKINIADLTYLVAYLFGTTTGPAPGCPLEGNVNGDVWEFINIADLSYLSGYLFGTPSGDPPPDCP